MAVVPASSRASSSSSGLATLFDSQLGADAATLDTGAGGIAAGGGAVLVMLKIRSAKAAANSDTFSITLNNDSGAHYAHTTGNARNVASFGTDTGGYIAPPSYLSCPAATSPAGEFGFYSFDIHRYADAIQHMLHGTGGYDVDGTNFQLMWHLLAYNQAAAISRMAIACAGGSVLAGSRLTVLQAY